MQKAREGTWAVACIDLANIYLMASAMTMHWVRSWGHFLEEREIGKNVHKVSDKFSRRGTHRDSGSTSGVQQADSLGEWEEAGLQGGKERGREGGKRILAAPCVEGKEE